MTLDACPSCKGIWFDQGEFRHYMNPIMQILVETPPFKIWYECEDCKVTRSYSQHDAGDSSPKCLRCAKTLVLKTVRLFERAEWRRDFKGLLIYSIPIAILFLANYY